jgi:hypothetical protein
MQGTYIVVTNKRRLNIEAEKRQEAYDKAWKMASKGEEILYVIVPKKV